MNYIKLFSNETYSDEITNIRKKVLGLSEEEKKRLVATKYLCDYMNDAMWASNSECSFLIHELKEILKKGRGYCIP